MTKIVAAQTWLLEEDLRALKIKSGQRSTKEALAKAVEAYLKPAEAAASPEPQPAG